MDRGDYFSMLVVDLLGEVIKFMPIEELYLLSELNAYNKIDGNSAIFKNIVTQHITDDVKRYKNMYDCDTYRDVMFHFSNYIAENNSVYDIVKFCAVNNCRIYLDSMEKNENIDNFQLLVGKYMGVLNIALNLDKTIIDVKIDKPISVKNFVDDGLDDLIFGDDDHKYVSYFSLLSENILISIAKYFDLEDLSNYNVFEIFDEYRKLGNDSEIYKFIFNEYIGDDIEFFKTKLISKTQYKAYGNSKTTLDNDDIAQDDSNSIISNKHAVYKFIKWIVLCDDKFLSRTCCYYKCNKYIEYMKKHNKLDTIEYNFVCTSNNVSKAFDSSLDNLFPGVRDKCKECNSDTLTNILNNVNNLFTPISKPKTIKLSHTNNNTSPEDTAFDDIINS